MKKLIQDHRMGGKKTVLRPLQNKDIEMLRRWRNKNRHFFFDSSFISKKRQQKWYKNIYLKNNNDLIFIIETLKKKAIGTVSLYHFNQQKKEAEYGRMLIGDGRYRKKGYAKDASLTLINLAFSSLDLDRIVLEVLKNNRPAIKLYERIGFKKTKNQPNRQSKTIKMEVRKTKKLKL